MHYYRQYTTPLHCLEMHHPMHRDVTTPQVILYTRVCCVYHNILVRLPSLSRPLIYSTPTSIHIHLSIRTTYTVTTIQIHIKQLYTNFCQLLWHTMYAYGYPGKVYTFYICLEICKTLTINPVRYYSYFPRREHTSYLAADRHK